MVVDIIDFYEESWLYFSGWNIFITYEKKNQLLK